MPDDVVALPVRDVAWPRLRRTVWAALALVACALHGPLYLQSLTVPGRNIADFFQEWASAKNTATGLPVYAPLRETVPLYLSNVSTGAYFTEINAHPPTAVLIALPLASLSYERAFLVWNWLSLAAIVASGWLVVREWNVPWSNWCLPPALTVLLGSPFLEHFALGQLGAFLLLLITAAWIADRRGHDVAAGALLAAATAIKLFPGFLFLYFVLKGKWRTVAAGAAALVVVTAVTAAVVGPQAYVDYVNRALPEVAKFRTAWSNRSLQGLWLRVFHEAAVPASAAFAISAGFVLAVLVRLTRRSRRTETDDLAFALYLPATLLLSPITWDHYFILLLPFALVIGRRLVRPDVWRALFRCALFVMWFDPFFFTKLYLGPRWEPRAVTLSENLPVVSLSVFALVGLFAVAAATTRRAMAATVAEPIVAEPRATAAYVGN